MDLHMFVRDHAHAYIVRRTVILYMEIPPTLHSGLTAVPSSKFHHGHNHHPTKGFDWYILSVQPLPAAQGGTLLLAKNRCLPFDIFTYIHLLQMENNKKENKNKTNNNNNSKQQVVETFCGYFLKTYQNQTANANKRKNNSKKSKISTRNTSSKICGNVLRGTPSEKKEL